MQECLAPFFFNVVSTHGFCSQNYVLKVKIYIYGQLRIKEQKARAQTISQMFGLIFACTVDVNNKITVATGNNYLLVNIRCDQILAFNESTL